MTLDTSGYTAQLPAGMNLAGLARSLWKQFLRMRRARPRSLRLCETLPLGDRRFVAVVEYEQARFLIGGTSGSLVLLTELGDKAEREWVPDKSQAAAAREEAQS